MRVHRPCFKFQKLTEGLLSFVFLCAGLSGIPQANADQENEIEDTFHHFLPPPREDLKLTDFFSTEGFKFQLKSENSWYCPVVSLPETNSNFSALNGECLANLSTKQGDEDFSQDLSVCQCLNSKPAVSLPQTAFQLGKDFDPKLHENYLTQKAMNRNIERLNQMLEAEQNAMQFQSSTLPASSAQVGDLISAFTNRVNFNVSEKLSEVKSSAERAFAERSDRSAPPQAREPMAEIKITPPNGKLLGAPSGEDAFQYDQMNFCLPLRQFMTGKQVPEEPFFEDLQSMGPKFVQSDWDYTQLKREFLKLSADVNTLSEAINRTDSKGIKAKKLYQRIKFLERNPLYRNLFSSTLRSAETKKQELYKMIREAYGSQVPASERFQKFNKLRYDTGAFFTASPEMEKIVQNGASENLSRLIQQVPHRVNKISLAHDPVGDWFTARVPVDGPLIDAAVIDNKDNGRRDTETYLRYCPKIEFSSKQNQFMVHEELERGFAGIYQSNPYQNEEFAKLNSNFCSRDRKSKDGKLASNWPEYLKKICQGRKTGDCHPDRHPEMIARFVEEYPDPASPEEGTVSKEDLAFLLPFLKGDAYLPEISSETVKTAILAGNDPKTARAQVASTFTNISSGFRENSKIIERTGTLNPIRDVARTSESSVIASRNLLKTPESNSGSSSLVQAVPPEASAAAGVIPNQGSSAQALRSEVQRTNTEVSDIEKELSSLRSELTQETSKPETNQNTSVIGELNERIQRASENLAERTKESADLQRRLEEIESLENKTTKDTKKKPRLNNGSAPLGSSAAGVQAITPQALSNTTQSVSGFSPSGLAPQPALDKSVQATSKTDLLRSKYSNEPVSENAITVSNPATVSEYQQLSEKASAQSVTVPFSTEEFQKLSVSDREKYFLGTDSLVIRMSFSDGAAFVVRNGTKMEIVPIEEGIKRGIASESESSAQPNQIRDKTLKALQEEFGL